HCVARHRSRRRDHDRLRDDASFGRQALYLWCEHLPRHHQQNIICAICGLKSWQREAEPGSASFFRVELHLSAMLLDNFAHERQSQTRRLLVFLPSFTNDAIELVPNTLFRFGGNSVTAILHTDANRFSLERG